MIKLDARVDGMLELGMDMTLVNIPIIVSFLMEIK
jgi:hypothetical protein